MGHICDKTTCAGGIAITLAVMLCLVLGCRCRCEPTCIPSYQRRVLSPLDTTGCFPQRTADASVTPLPPMPAPVESEELVAPHNTATESVPSSALKILGSEFSQSDRGFVSRIPRSGRVAS